MLRKAVLIPIALATLVATAVPSGARPLPAAPACPMFPDDSHWHAPVDQLPVHPSSAQLVASMGAGSKVHADFGSGLWDGGPIGIPYTVVDASQPKVAVSFDFADESDPGPYPIPANPPIEGGPGSSGDRHVLIVDRSACTLYELYDAHPNGDGTWHAGSGAVYDLRSNALRPAGWTSADAAGLPILPGLVTYDEVASGRIDHAIRVTANRTDSSYVWPARHQAGSANPSLPPMGLRLRLKAGFDISGYPRDDQVILQAMKTYGMIVADNGSSWYISGAPDERWDNDVLHVLGQVPGSSFEALDASSLMVDPSSGSTKTSNPFGNVDGVSVAPGGVTIAGWAIDPDSSGPIGVHLYLDGSFAGALDASIDRPDVGAAFPASGPRHGFSAVVPITPGNHVLCAFAINAGPGTTNPQLGCRYVPWTGNPFGNVDAITLAPGGASVQGWTVDPDSSSSIRVHVYVNGGLAAITTADRPRLDVGAYLPGFGTAHGFAVNVALLDGANSVCAYGINVGPGSTNPQVGCFTVPYRALPVGSLDRVRRTANGLRVQGWTIDPDTAGAVQVHTYVDGAIADITTASQPRPDVGAAFAGFGAAHGYDVVIPAGAGPHTVCTYAINVGGGDSNPLLGCAVS
ncbi:MAG: hypothetical protein QOJ67_2126 [Acidimicrobiaceae bacterium]